MNTKEQGRVIRLRTVMDNLNGVRQILDALTNEGRDDQDALRLMSAEIDGAVSELDGIAEAMENVEGVE